MRLRLIKKKEPTVTPTTLAKPLFMRHNFLGPTVTRVSTYTPRHYSANRVPEGDYSAAAAFALEAALSLSSAELLCHITAPPVHGGVIWRSYPEFATIGTPRARQSIQ